MVSEAARHHAIVHYRRRWDYDRRGNPRARRAGDERRLGDGNLPEIFPRTFRQALTEAFRRSEEHTSELQSLAYLVCRLLLEKKKKKKEYKQDRYSRQY